MNTFLIAFHFDDGFRVDIIMCSCRYGWLNPFGQGNKTYLNSPFMKSAYTYKGFGLWKRNLPITNGEYVFAPKRNL